MQKIKVLCIEDNPGDVKLINELLFSDGSYNFEFSSTDRIEKVKEIANNSVFDAILLDLTLPDSSGIETVEIVKLYFPNTPIITLSGSYDEEMTLKTIQSGAQDHLNKNSVTTDLLTHSIRYSIDRYNFLKRLGEEKQQFSNLIDNNSDGMMVINNQGTIKYLNPECENIFSRTKEELLNQSFGFPVYINESTEISILGLNSMNKVVEMRVADIIWEGEKCKLAALRDITVRKEIEEKNIAYGLELEKLNLQKDKFYSIIAHDLKSPFNSILGYLELLNENVRTYDIEKTEKMLGIITTSANNTFSLLEDLLIWARSQSGKMPFEPKILPLNEICQFVIGNLEQTAANKNITIKHSAKEGITVFADSDMLKTILRNLASNAIKFTNPGGRIDFSATQTDSNLTISVSDTGIGIRPEVMQTIFDFTKTLTTKGTQNESGTGLGLSLCKEFVGKHGGEIWVESEVGKGTTFNFTMPNISEK